MSRVSWPGTIGGAFLLGALAYMVKQDIPLTVVAVVFVAVGARCWT